MEDMIELIKSNWGYVKSYLIDKFDVSEELSYDTWIKPLIIDRIVKDEKGSETLYFIGRDKMFCNIVNKKYAHPLSIAIEHVTNRKYDVKIEIKKTVKRTSIINNKRKLLSKPKINDSNLNAKYTFNNFVVGKSNTMAHAASLAVAESPGEIYNPLFIYGGPGLGKTHLLNAIGNEVLENIPDARIKYVPAETFINDFLEHLRLGEMDSFKKIYRSLDLLLIDDIQALSKKVSTQEEFFNTFNALHGENKQIVLTSDRSPDYLENLEERLVTRFKWGLTSDITPPNFETRIAILRNKIEEFDLIFPNETIEYLAGQFDSNVRDLEGALKDINLLASMKQIKEITIDIAAEAIRSRKQAGSQLLVIPIDRIQTEVGNFYGVSVKEMKGTRRVQNIVLARQVAMYLTRELTDNSLPKIGREFGGKDHTTVIHAHGKIKSMLEEDDNLRLEIESIKNKIK